MSQLRNDLLDRIKERHDLWFNDAMELYEMGKLKPHYCANDTITVMTFRIVWLLDHYDVDLDEFVKGLRRTLTYYREAKE